MKEGKPGENQYCRIIAISEKGVIKFKYDNLNYLFELDAKTLIFDDNKIYHFSSVDIVKIARAMVCESPKIRRKVVGYDLNTTRPVFRIEENGIEIEKKGNLQLSDPEILNTFPARDAYCIGYFHGLYATDKP